ncbi:tetratricopeptide (TPR) repeat protein [Catenulispora sp. EB89]|uniref:CHAT domain-containing tetratricopeptide repeat protein n=1 Tax=Catenulispora sp. EB89 TaxID=3156257 RepID=UPI0035166E16
MEKFLAALQRRLESYVNYHDASGILADEALEDAVRLLRVAGTPADDGHDLPFSEWITAVNAVAWLYWYRSLELPDEDELRYKDRSLAVELFSIVSAVDPTLVPDELRGDDAPATAARDYGPQGWAEQAVTLLTEGRHFDDPSALDLAIRLLRKAVEPDFGHPDWPLWLSDLCSALRMRFERTGDVADIDAAIVAGRQAVAATVIEHPDRAGLLTDLGRAQLARFDSLNTMSDLDDAVDASLAAAECTPVEDAKRPGRMNSLSVVLQTRFEWTGDVADIDMALSAAREAVVGASGEGPSRAGYLSTLGLALHRRYICFRDVADLSSAITATQTGVEAAPVGDSVQTICLNNLGDMLRMRFEHLGDPSDLDAAVTALQQVVGPDPTTSVDLTALSNLCIALRVRFERFGDVADIDGATAIGRRAIAVTPADHVRRAEYLSNLCLALLSRFEHVGDAADIDAAVAAIREALAVGVSGLPDQADRPWYLSMLSGTLRERFQRLGRVTDLDEAITVIREAIAATEHHPRPAFLHNLNLALQARFERDGELADIDAAVNAGQAAVSATPTGHYERPGCLSSLGTALWARFTHGGEPDDLDAAVAACRQAVEATLAGDLDRALHLSMYGITLHRRFRLVGDQEDLDAAITAERDAIEATPAIHPDRALYLSNHTASLIDRFKLTRDVADIDAAVATGQEAIAAVRTDHPFRGRFLLVAGDALEARFEHTKDPADADAALGAWREATTITTAPAQVRIQTGRAWGRLAAMLGRWPDAADGYARAVEFLPLLAWLGAGRRSRERLLTSEGSALAADAAACAIAAGQPERAIELLEQGRAVLWSQMLETRTDLTALRLAHPDLAARLDRLRAQLDGTAATPHTPSFPHNVDARIASARQWSALLDQVRELSGFHDFARLPALTQLREAAAGGTVVMINISGWRCDALLVSEVGVNVKELPDLTQAATVERVNTYLDALREFQSSSEDPATARDVMEREIAATLEWLWESIAEPVLDALGHHRLPADDQWPRLWWCPMGPLAILPLHAAGYHSEPGHHSVLDRVISSYTPTLRALSAARSRPQPTSPGRLLLIAQPYTPGAPPLPAARLEQGFLASQFDDTQLTLLTDVDATHAGIRNKLATHAQVHAACHGHQDLHDPTSGGLLPHDWNRAGLLSVLDLAASEHAGGEFAFLSACKSATGGITIMDEAVNLAAALHYAGWRHVIGTLWSVWDADAAFITRDTYQHLVNESGLDPNRSAEALHHALRGHRERPNHRAQPSRWAPFLHIGP